jgi:hypothetical protein
MFLHTCPVKLSSTVISLLHGLTLELSHALNQSTQAWYSRLHRNMGLDGVLQLGYANVIWFDLGAIGRAVEAEYMRDVSEGQTINGEQVRQVFEAMLP